MQLTDYPSIDPKAGFGTEIFTLESVRSQSSEYIYNELIQSLRKDQPISEQIADAIATLMKNWALRKGAQYFAHWFLPMHGISVLKRKAFLRLDWEEKPLQVFDGRALTRQRPSNTLFNEESSRQTFEGRGYTFWDPSSPAFLFGTGSSKTLCIPTTVIGENGEALDDKTPLNRSLNALKTSAIQLCQYFDKGIEDLDVMCGWEQEFYLIDQSFMEERQDLMLNERALIGQSAPTYGRISMQNSGFLPKRIQEYFRELDEEALKLGISLQTWHSEQSPGQYEITAHYRKLNIAVDQNLILMDLMRQIGDKHHLHVIFNEKPFYGLNGNSKHLNWSIHTKDDTNLLNPGTKSKNNLQFLIFIACIMKSLQDHGQILLAAVASAGNELRLGEKDAPPKCISLFLGKKLTKIIDHLAAQEDFKFDKGENLYVALNIHRIKLSEHGNIDPFRNSPVAFTGSKLEFRVVGGGSTNAFALTSFHTALSSAIQSFCRKADYLIEQGEKKEEALLKVLKDFINKSRSIVYNDNPNTKTAIKYFEDCGLRFMKSAPETMALLKQDSAYKLFEEQSVLNRSEINSRILFKDELYAQIVIGESETLVYLVQNVIIYEALKFYTERINPIESIEGLNTTAQKGKVIIGLVNDLQVLCDQMDERIAKISVLNDMAEKAYLAQKELRAKYTQRIVTLCDQLEKNMGDSYWPLSNIWKILYTRIKK
jgi:glutamine synthetase